MRTFDESSVGNWRATNHILDPDSPSMTWAGFASVPNSKVRLDRQGHYTHELTSLLKIFDMEIGISLRNFL